jgi:diguanylate cyclase (GGDEF)-like protein
LFGVAALSAVLVGALGLAGVAAAMSVGTATCGVIALVSGLVLLVRGWSGPPPTRFRRWLGAALTLWGLGQVLQGVIAVLWTPTFPTPGDVLSFGAAPLAVVGILMIPRPRSAMSPPWRLCVDSALVTVTAALLVWRFGFLGLFTRDGSLALDGGSSLAVVIMVADLTVTALIFLTGVRDLDRNILLVAAGVACYAIGDLLTLHGILDGGTWPWQGALLWCLAWPPIAHGLLRYDPTRSRRVDRDRDLDVDPDARVVLVATCTGLAVLAAGVAGVIVSTPRVADPVSLWFVVVALVVLGVRELLTTRMRRRLLGRLSDEATTDPLTGLSNRRVLVRRLAEVTGDRSWSLLTVDLDGFKEVNAVLGHPVGDRLLVAAGQRIAEVVPYGALVCRVGGDEFAVLIRVDTPAAVQLGERLVTAVRRSAGDVPGVDRVGVSASVGVTPLAVPGVTPRSAGEATDPLAALSAAGAALRAAKAIGRDRVEVFDEAAARVRHRRLLVEERLRGAVLAGRIDVVFQPIVDLRRGGEVAGAEALARWTDDVLGVVDPIEFIPVAEETGIVVALGELVLDRTLEEATRHGFGAQGVRVSCNVSPVQLRVPGFHKVVIDALRAHSMPPDLLVVEVTEAVLIEQDGPGVQTLRLLAEAGVTVAIDDFGTGYSALGYLRRLPAHVLKIDRSLTRALTDEAEARAIVAAVVGLGRSLAVSVVVEGVETPEIADLATRLGAGYGQGSMFGDAVPAADLLTTARRMLAAAPVVAPSVPAQVAPATPGRGLGLEPDVRARPVRRRSA